MKLKNKMIKKIKTARRSTLVLVVLAVAAIGTYIIIRSQAQTPFVALNAANGNTGNSGASITQCAGSSDSCVVFSGATAIQGILPPSNPSVALAGNPDWVSTCFSNRNSVNCLSLVQQAINNARTSIENNMSGLALPSGGSINLTNFSNMPHPEQLWVMINLERINRGLQPFDGVTAQLSQAAFTTGAQAYNDPTLSASTLTGGVSFNGRASIWAGGTNDMSADYGWIYNDAMQANGTSTNGDCTASNTSGCWGHRDVILCNGTSGFAGWCKSAHVFVGVGSSLADSSKGYHESSAAIFIPTNGVPTDVICSWTQALSDLTNGTSNCSGLTSYQTSGI